MTPFLYTLAVASTVSGIVFLLGYAAGWRHGKDSR